MGQLALHLHVHAITYLLYAPGCLQLRGAGGSTLAMVGMMGLSEPEKRTERFITLVFTLGWVAKCCLMISTSA